MDYRSPPESVKRARDLMRNIREALTRDSHDRFPAIYTDLDWEGMNITPPETDWRDMDDGDRHDLLSHALDEAIWGLEPAPHGEPSESQKLAMEFLRDEERPLFAEWRDDAVQRHLTDRMVRYEDIPNYPRPDPSPDPGRTR